MQEQLPPGWVWQKIGDICKTTSGGTPSRRRVEYFQGTIPWVKSGELPDGFVTTVEEYITEEAIKNSSAKIFPKGTLLIAMYGATVGKLGILNMEAATNQAVCAIFHPDSIERNFLFWYLKSIRKQLLEISFGGAQPNISQTVIKDTFIPVPYPEEPERSLAEQRRIVARIEALLAEVREMRKLHDEITAVANKLMDAVLAEIYSPEELASWQKAPLGELAQITARQVDPTLPEHRNLPHIYGATIEEGTGRLLEYNTAAEDGMTSGKYHFKPGAVLYSKIRPYLRKVAIVDFEGLCSADMYPLRLKTDELTPEFLMWSLLSPPFTNYANSLSVRARIPKLNRTQLFGYEMPYPGKEIQESICHHIRHVRKEVGEIQQLNKSEMDYLDQLEQAILAQAFRGEL